MINNIIIIYFIIRIIYFNLSLIFLLSSLYSRNSPVKINEIIKLTIPKDECDVRKPYEEPVGIETNYIFHTDDIWKNDKIMIIMNGTTQMPVITSI